MMRLAALGEPGGRVIALCWMVFIVVWAISALFVKRTVERSTGWPRLVTLAVVLLLFGVMRGGVTLGPTLWPRSATLETIAIVLTLAGLMVALWARAALGRNWSGAIVYKQDHELIQRGPYAYVRHPIYSGLLLMGFGTAVANDQLGGFVILAVTLVALRIKAHMEEQLMTRHFPEAYPEYRRRVKALIPGVW